MTTANWLVLLGSIVSVGLVAGGLLVRMQVAERAIKEFARAREKQGERIGGVEERVALLEGAGELDARIAALAKRTRKRTRPTGVPTTVPTDESGEA